MKKTNFAGKALKWAAVGCVLAVTTLASLVGGTVPADRLIDGVDQTDFFVGKTDKSAREGFVVYVGEEIFGVKWRNWKMLTKGFDNARGSGNIVQHGVPYFYNLYSDPKEAYPITMKTPEHFSATGSSGWSVHRRKSRRLTTITSSRPSTRSRVTLIKTGPKRCLLPKNR
jgi:hypothetical protein